MADLSAWSLALAALLPPLAVAVIAALRGSVATRLIAVQLATALTALLLMLMSFVFDQPSYVSLAVALALLNVVGTVLMAMVVERWL